MSSRLTALASASVAALTLLTPPAAVLASAPGNDDIASPIAVLSIPYGNGQDTTEATNGATDFDCAGAGHTVWYQYTATATGRLEANTFGSDFDTTLVVGTPDGSGGIAAIGCNDDTQSLQSRVRWDATMGTTYLFQAGSFADSPGGNLVFSVDIAPPLVPVVVALTLNSSGKVDRNGAATITGTLSCEGATDVEIDASLRQQTGRFLLSAENYDVIPCSATSAPWQLVLSTPMGKFGSGKAQVWVFAGACGDEDCDSTSLQQTITLKK